MKELKTDILSQLEWLGETLGIVAYRLGWSSILLAKETVERLSAGEYVTIAGSEDGYNLSLEVTIQKGEWVICGGCGYGSSIRIRGFAVHFSSCGNHHVGARRSRDGSTEWDADDQPSMSSWGDESWSGNRDSRIEELRELEGRLTAPEGVLVG